jgi:hypothetical protein
VAKTLHLNGERAIFSIAGALLMGLSTACGTSSTQGAITSPTPAPTFKASPTPDAATLKYIALIHNYWIQIQAADEETSGTKVAARVCLGMVSLVAPVDLQLVDPLKCRQRMLAGLPVQQRFLSALMATTPPLQFAAEDQVFKTQLPQAIVDLKTLISTTAGGNKEAVLEGATVYVGDLIPSVTDAMDYVDPSVVHI